VKRQNLLPIAYYIAALVVPENSEERQWLKERFRPLLNLFQGSWAYQEMAVEEQQKGEQKGLRALQEICIRYIQKRFPTLADQAKQQISVVIDINRLHIAFDAVMDAANAAEVEQILVHLSDEAQSTQ
jgi:hypothetical protein